jgi:hypothetical protein
MFFKGSRSVGQGGVRRVAKSAAGTLILTALVLFWTSTAKADDDAVAAGREIVVAEGSTANDIACVFCDVHVHGDVKGDVAIAFGNLEVDPGHEIAGDVAVFAGRVRLADHSRVNGDVAIVGRLQDEAATVNGSRAVVPGEILLVPLALLAGLIWLIVHLVQRNRYRPSYPPGYPGQRV